MKHLKLFLMMFMAANIALVTSCKKDDDGDDGPVNEDPTISLAGDMGNVASDVTLETDEAYMMTVSAAQNASTTKKLQRMLITREVAGTPTTFLDSSFNEATFGPFTINVKAPAVDGAEDTWKFTVTDKDGKTATTGLTVTAEAPVNSTPLATETTGQFYHRDGTLKGAYDLVNDAEVSALDPDDNKDMANTDAAGNGFTGSFQAPNATRYSPTSETYDNIPTVEKAQDLYDNGGIPLNTINDPAVGDVYVVKLRNNEYAVVEITENDPANNECSCGNTGKLSFKYKKQ